MTTMMDRLDTVPTSKRQQEVDVRIERVSQGTREQGKERESLGDMLRENRGEKKMKEKMLRVRERESGSESIRDRNS